MTGGLGVLPHTHVILATDASETGLCNSLVSFVPPGPASDLTLATCGHCAQPFTQPCSATGVLFVTLLCAITAALPVTWLCGVTVSRW